MISPETLLQQALLMESYGANCIYCTDSAGYMMPHDVTAHIALLRETLKPNTEIGFHGHHNLALGVANSMAAVMDRMGVETGVNTFKLMNVAEEKIVPMKDHIVRVGQNSLTLGYASVYSSFLLFAKSASAKHGVPSQDILLEMARRNATTTEHPYSLPPSHAFTNRTTLQIATKLLSCGTLTPDCATAVPLDYSTLDALRLHHPAWRLLRSDHAPLIASFLHRVFIIPNVRIMAQADLVEALEDELFALRERLGDQAFPKSAQDYLNDWASPDKGWLRKFYRRGSDEPQFDLTPATEKGIAWLDSLTERSFIGTESRLLTLFDLLKQMNDGSEADPKKRIDELRKRRAEIDADIARIELGDIPLLDDTALKDRFQQFTQIARDLLTDFREVEHNFRQLDRRVRERIALWEGAKGMLLEQIMGERDAIADSDQGRSFRAFWDFLMSSRRQDELSQLLDNVLRLPAVSALDPDPRTRRIHYDWLEAGEHTQRTVAQLSQQLRRFLDDQAWLENRRIMDILHAIEARALGVRAQPPMLDVIHIDDVSADIDLPMERPLHTPAIKPVIANMAIDTGDDDVDASALYSQVVVDRARLARHLRQALQTHTQITLHALLAQHPLQQGLAELITWIQLGNESCKTVVDENTIETIAWQSRQLDGTTRYRRARLPRIIFMR